MNLSSRIRLWTWESAFYRTHTSIPRIPPGIRVQEGADPTNIDPTSLRGKKPGNQEEDKPKGSQGVRKRRRIQVPVKTSQVAGETPRNSTETKKQKKTQKTKQRDEEQPTLFKNPDRRQHKHVNPKQNQNPVADSDLRRFFQEFLRSHDVESQESGSSYLL